MKSSWLLKLSILATVLAMLTGCPALSNLMELISKEQAKPKKTITITGIPPEYEGSLMQVVAPDFSDALGERLCLSGGMDGRVVKDGKGKTLILEINAQKANTERAGLVAIAKNIMGIAKSCDNRKRFVVLSLSLPDGYEEQDADALTKKILDRTFIYTKGINICEASADAAPNIKIAYGFSEMESTLEFKDFMRASDCEILMEIVRSAEGSEEYVVIKEADLIVRDNPILAGKEVSKFASGSIINVSLPKQTKEADDYLWTNVYYKDKDGNNKRGWVTELASPSTAKAMAILMGPYDNLFIIPNNWSEYFVISDIGVNIREANDPNANKITTIKLGEKLIVSKTFETKYEKWIYEWAEVLYEGYNPEKKIWVAKGKYEYQHPENSEKYMLPFPTKKVETIDFPDEILGKVTYMNGDEHILNSNGKNLTLGGGDVGTVSYYTGEVPLFNGKYYYVAVGPKIFHEDYPDSGSCNIDEFKWFSRLITVEVQYEDKPTETINCVVADIKEHSYNMYNGKHKKRSKNVTYAEVRKKNDGLVKNGIMQTGIRYPNASGSPDDSVEEENMKDDGSVIEFMGQYINSGKIIEYMNSNNITIPKEGLTSNELKKFKVVKVTSNEHRTSLFKETKLKLERGNSPKLISPEEQ